MAHQKKYKLSIKKLLDKLMHLKNILNSFQNEGSFMFKWLGWL